MERVSQLSTSTTASISRWVMSGRDRGIDVGIGIDRSSRGAATDLSPRRETWVKLILSNSPGGAAESFAPTGLAIDLPVSHGFRHGLRSGAAPRLFPGTDVNAILRSSRSPIT